MEQSGTDEDENYLVLKERKRKVINYFAWKRKLYYRSKCGKENLTRKLSGPIGRAQGVRTVLDTGGCLFGSNMLNEIVILTNKYIASICLMYSRKRNRYN